MVVSSLAQTEALDKHEVWLTVRGMSCGSCAARLESRLNALDGVDASVNFATERACVRTSVPTSTLLSEVQAAGFTAQAIVGRGQRGWGYPFRCRPPRADPRTPSRRGWIALHAPLRCIHRFLDCAIGPIRRLAVAPVGLGTSSRDLVCVAVLHGCIAPGSSRPHHDGHAGLHRDSGRNLLVGLCDVLSRR